MSGPANAGRHTSSSSRWCCCCCCCSRAVGAASAPRTGHSGCGAPCCPPCCTACRLQSRRVPNTGPLRASIPATNSIPSRVVIDKSFCIEMSPFPIPDAPRKKRQPKQKRTWSEHEHETDAAPGAILGGLRWDSETRLRDADCRVDLGKSGLARHRISQDRLGSGVATRHPSANLAECSGRCAVRAVLLLVGAHGSRHATSNLKHPEPPPPPNSCRTPSV